MRFAWGKSLWLVFYIINYTKLLWWGVGCKTRNVRDKPVVGMLTRERTWKCRRNFLNTPTMLFHFYASINASQVRSLGTCRYSFDILWLSFKFDVRHFHFCLELNNSWQDRERVVLGECYVVHVANRLFQLHPTLQFHLLFYFVWVRDRVVVFIWNLLSKKCGFSIWFLSIY